MIHPVGMAVRADPDVIAAATAVGRILPSAIAGTMPPGFDPFRAQTRREPLRPDES